VDNGSRQASGSEDSDVPDRALVKQLAEAGTDSVRQNVFAAVYERHQRTVLMTCGRFLNEDLDAAESAAAEAFTQAFQDLTAGRGPREPDKLGAWLNGIALNRCREELRRRLPGTEIPQDTEQDTTESASRARQAMVDRILEAVAASLTPTQRTVYELSTRRHLRGQALAEALDVSEAEANRRTYENKQRLMEGFGAYVLVQQGRPYCPDLAGILDAAQWDGTNFTKVLRARILRHMATCKTCGNCGVCRTTQKHLIKPLAPVLLAAIAGEALYQRVRTATIHSGNTSSSTPTSTKPPGGRRPPNDPPGTSRPRRMARRLAGRPRAMIGAAVIAAVAVVTVLVLPPLLSHSGGSGVTLAQATSELAALAPGMTPVAVAVPGGFEAATYDEHTHIDFWRYSAGSWKRLAARQYPPDAGDGTGTNEHGVTAKGAVLSGMDHATFIVNGPFTGDGTGQTAIFGDGPSGWGYLPVTPDASSMISTGQSATASDTGVFYRASFVNGRMQVGIDTGVFNEAFSAGFLLLQTWRGSARGYAFADDNIVTAATVPTPQFGAAPLPSTSPPDGTYGALVSQVVVGFDSKNAEYITVSAQPAALTQDCVLTGSCAASQSTAMTITAATATKTVFPVITGQGTSYITGPTWALAGLYIDLSSPLDPYQNPATFAQRGATPWYIPASLGATSFALSQGEPAVLTFHNGTVTKIELG
jgi:RNA polymerase sigma factor (sigma-70 family)